MKIDLSKAFDRVEWNFLLRILRNTGFNQTFINWVYQCIATTSMSILLNGSPYGFFRPTRGLRQGDPLSPYLFIIVMEAVSRMLYRAEQMKEIKEVKVSRNGPTISHLFFVDDLIIMSSARLNKISHYKSILDKFCVWSGQEINFNKYGIHFSKKCKSSHKKGYKIDNGNGEAENLCKVSWKPIIFEEEKV